MTPDHHPVAWSAWLAAAALPALLTRNPLYLSLVLLAVGITYLALGQSSPLARSWGAFVRFGATLWLLTIPFVALTSHQGNLVLFSLPANWPVIGGPITAESLLYGLCTGPADHHPAAGVCRFQRRRGSGPSAAHDARLHLPDGRGQRDRRRLRAADGRGLADDP